MINYEKHFYDTVAGSILGYAVADALGVPGEFLSRAQLAQNPIVGMRAGGIHGQPAGTWSDDTSMTLCAADSIIQTGIDYYDLMSRFADWCSNAKYTAHDEVFDIGNTTRFAIASFVRGAAPLESGDPSDYACGNGSLMRVLPIAIYISGRYRNLELDDRTAELIHNTSKCTHAHPRCQMACGIYCSVAFQLFAGTELKQAVKKGIRSGLAYYREQESFASVYSDFQSLENLELWPEDHIRSSGFVLHTLQAALWCILTTSSYSECVLKAVNLGKDTDTTAAVAGGLAGIWYGEKAIPTEWKNATAKYSLITEFATSLAKACLSNPTTSQN